MLDLAKLHRMSRATGYASTVAKPDGIDLSGGQIFGLHAPQTLELSTRDFAYQPPQGDAMLRQRYLSTLHKEPELADNVIVTVGAKQALFLAFSFFASKTRMVLVPSPGWMPYSILASSHDMKLVQYNPQDIPTLIELIEQYSSSLIVLNYPHNPTGFSCSAEELKLIIEAACRSSSEVICDEVYRAIDPAAVSAVQYLDTGRVSVVDSISKWAGAAGLRVGFLAGSKDLLEFSLSAIGAMTSGTSLISQQWALKHIQDESTVKKAIHASAISIKTLEKDLTQSGHVVVSRGSIYLWVSGGPSFEINGSQVFGVSGELFNAKGFTRLCPLCGPNPWNALASSEDQ